MNTEELNTSEFKKLCQTAYARFIQTNEDLGKLIEPSFRLAVFPDLEKNKIISRDFKTEYLDERDQVGGNLYKWIHQSFSVLFEVDKENMEIVLFSSTINMLGGRFATLLKIEKKVAIKSVSEMIIYLGLEEINWELCFKANAIHNSKNEIINNQFRLKKMDNLRMSELFKDSVNSKVFNRFVKMFA